MPKVLHTITVAFEVTTNKISTLDNINTAMKRVAVEAIKRKAEVINQLGESVVEVVG